MDELSRRLMADGNLSEALWNMQNSRLRDSHNRQLPSLKEMLRRLQEKRRNQLKRFNLDSIMDEFRQALEDIVKTEKEGIQKKIEEINQKAQQGSRDLSPETVQKIIESMQDKARQNLEKTGQFACRRKREGQ